MIKFSEIESFKHCVKGTRRYCNDNMVELPIKEYVGTVKIHGSNLGLMLTSSGELIPQSRNRVISVNDDVYGFASWAQSRQDVILELFNTINNPASESITFYGEWCGKGIQRSVAVAELDRHWVLFAVRIGEDYAELPHDLYNNENGIYNIHQVPTYEVTVDFSKPAEAADIMAQFTQDVEDECPWGKFRGVSGTGEGIVWRLRDDPTDSRYWFKTKGVKHKGKDGHKPKIAISEEKLSEINELLNEILPEWRLEQGLSHLRENNKDVIIQNIGEYLKWVSQDTLKEEKDAVEASGNEWKDVAKHVNKRAKDFYLNEVDGW